MEISKKILNLWIKKRGCNESYWRQKQFFQQNSQYFNSNIYYKLAKILINYKWIESLYDLSVHLSWFYNAVSIIEKIISLLKDIPDISKEEYIFLRHFIYFEHKNIQSINEIKNFMRAYNLFSDKKDKEVVFNNFDLFKHPLPKQKIIKIVNNLKKLKAISL